MKFVLKSRNLQKTLLLLVQRFHLQCRLFKLKDIDDQKYKDNQINLKYQNLLEELEGLNNNEKVNVKIQLIKL